MNWRAAKTQYKMRKNYVKVWICKATLIETSTKNTELEKKRLVSHWEPNENDHFPSKARKTENQSILIISYMMWNWDIKCNSLISFLSCHKDSSYILWQYSVRDLLYLSILILPSPLLDSQAVRWSLMSMSLKRSSASSFCCPWLMEWMRCTSDVTM